MATNETGESSNRARSGRTPKLSLEPYHISSSSPTTRKPHLVEQNAGGSGSPVMTSITEGEPLAQIASMSSSRGGDSSTLASDNDDSRHVRTLPPWIESFEVGNGNGNGTGAGPTSRFLSAPSQARTAQHHYDANTSISPSRRRSQDGYESDEDIDRVMSRQPVRGLFGGEKAPVRGRRWDFARDEDPVIVSRTPATQSPWVVNLVRSSMYGPALDEDRHQVDYEFLAAQTPGYMKPWRGDVQDLEKGEGLLHNKKRRRWWYQRAQHTLLMHPLVPLAFRVTVLTTSVIALGLSTSIFHLTNDSVYSQNPSTIMAIVVDVIAIPYIMYITWDEYTGKPLGLRSPKAKMRLVLLDLFFIIFESANLAIAFAALSDDDGSCRLGVNGTDMALCRRVKGLVSFLLMALIAWTFTFSVSIVRLVERVGGREEGD